MNDATRSCDELAAQLPLLALGELDAMEAAAARAHVENCARCSARLAELQRTRGALDLVAVGEAAPLSGATIRAASLALERAAPRGPDPEGRVLFPFSSFFSSRVAAAAALFIALGALGFAFGGWRRLALESQGSQESLERNREPAISPLALARALGSLEARVTALEERHDHDLLLLAQTVDHAQESRDHGIAVHLADFEQATRAELIATRSAIGDVARLIVPARAEVPLDEH